MEISMDQIKTLREQTGISVMQCKKAIEEAGGDMEKALILLRKKGSAVAQKKADRELGAGIIECYIHNTKQVGAMVELSCETDFVAKNEAFIKPAYDIAMHIAAAAPVCISREHMGEMELSKAREVFAEEVNNKPEEMREKILAGKLDAYFKDKVLLEQPFIKNPDVTIKALIEEGVQKFGEKIVVTRFARMALHRPE